MLPAPSSGEIAVSQYIEKEWGGKSFIGAKL